MTRCEHRSGEEGVFFRRFILLTSSLGHPVGATGARLIATLLHELERMERTYGLVAICEGAGMANATVIERL